jgi:hypothetical protein
MAVLAVVLGLGLAREARAQYQPQSLTINRYFYYPYYPFPHSYWPTQSPRWPEPPNSGYHLPPPAYMAYPAFKEPDWRYELWQPGRYYRGFHFWLDAF